MGKLWWCHKKPIFTFIQTKWICSHSHSRSHHINAYNTYGVCLRDNYWTWNERWFWLVQHYIFIYPIIIRTLLRPMKPMNDDGRLLCCGAAAQFVRTIWCSWSFIFFLIAMQWNHIGICHFRMKHSVRQKNGLGAVNVNSVDEKRMGTDLHTLWYC